MKAILAVCLFLVGLSYAEHYYFQVTEGQMTINKGKPGKFSGVSHLENSFGFSTFSGTYVDGSNFTPFTIGGMILKFDNNGKIDVDATCTEGSWDKKAFRPEGKVKLTGTLTDVTYHVDCEDKASKIHWEITGKAKASKCTQYSPIEAAVRAKDTIGKHAEDFSAVQVVNYAIIGYKYTIGKCKDYLDNFKKVDKSSAGFAIVGKDGEHCGIMDKDGDKFIHTNPVKKLVDETPLAMAKNFFKNGYVFVDCSC